MTLHHLREPRGKKHGTVGTWQPGSSAHTELTLEAIWIWTFLQPKSEAVWLTTTLVISSKRSLHFSPLPLRSLWPCRLFTRQAFLPAGVVSRQATQGRQLPLLC